MNKNKTKKVKTMKLSKTKGELRSLIEKTERLINNTLKDDGDTCEYSQRICLINALNGVDSAISGIDHDGLLDDEPTIERTDEGVLINGCLVDESLESESWFRLVEREEVINDLITWIGECKNSDFDLMKQDLKMLIDWTDDWILSSTFTNEYLSISYDRIRFIEQCEIIADEVFYA